MTDSAVDLPATSTGARALLDYWTAKRRGGALPAHADIDPVEIPRLLPNIALIEIEPGPRFRYRLVGTEIVRYRDGLEAADCTGRYADDTPHHYDHKAAVDDLHAAVAAGRPIYSSRPYSLESGAAGRWERLVLPLADDGRRIDRLLIWFRKW